MSTQANLYAPPTARVEDTIERGTEDEAIRQEHIKHEASIRSIGMLYYLGGALTGIGGLILVIVGLWGEFGPGLTFGMGAAYLALAGLSLALGRGLRTFQHWARVTSIVLSCIGLLGFPFGTLINGYILYLLLSAKGKRIFAADYQDIVAATPHIKYKTPVVLWIVLAVVLAGVFAAVLIPLVTR